MWPDQQSFFCCFRKCQSLIKQKLPVADCYSLYGSVS